MVGMYKAFSIRCKKRGLRQDVPTRWNSTFIMLESALFYKHAFQHLKLSDSNYTCCPSRSEWDKVEKINKFLGVFMKSLMFFLELSIQLQTCISLFFSWHT